jgi:predicted  nucleic acid-binding Zn-ribbon protein
MKTFMLYLSAFLLLCLYIFAQNYIERGRQINSLESEKTELKTQLKSKEAEIDEYNQKQLEASNTIQEVREVVKTVKEPCNCYGVALPARIADILHNNNQ